MIKNYIDSNIFLNPILYQDEKSNKCKVILSQLINKKFIGVTSVLTWDEIFYVTYKNLGREVAIREGDKFLRFPNLILIDANKNMISMAQKLIKNYKVNPRDAIHAATYILNGCNSIVSDDSDFDKIKELKRIEVL